MGFFSKLFGNPTDYSPGEAPLELERRATFGFRLAGCTNYQRAILPWPGRREHTAVIEHQPTNAHDSNAVRVSLGGKTVGYFYAEDAAAFVTWMRTNFLMGKRFKGPCKVVAAESPEDGREYLYVNLALKASPSRLVTA